MGLPVSGDRFIIRNSSWPPVFRKRETRLQEQERRCRAKCGRNEPNISGHRTSPSHGNECQGRALAHRSSEGLADTNTTAMSLAAPRRFQSALGYPLSTALLRRDRSPGSLHKRLHLLQGKAAIFISIHRLEDALVSRLKLLQ
jgi:hypothetical protein